MNLPCGLALGGPRLIEISAVSNLPLEFVTIEILFFSESSKVTGKIAQTPIIEQIVHWYF